MKTIQIVYGSTGGNTEMVCDYVTEQLTDKGYQVKNDRCEHFPIENLLKSDILILAAPTYECGVLEPYFLEHFWPKIQDLDLKGQKCTVIGLGDIKYGLDYHLESARILEEYIKTHNGEVFSPSLMVSGKPLPMLETMVKKWCERLDKKLNE